MHLKSLTLKGFKSFAQSTTFAFETGVTCVVGPNGSGKSNVVDALAWVMGEQGAKTLRGGKMDDVIFAGTSTRGPLGRAEVTLTIDNSDGALPIDYTEVTISRTLFRNGGSEYAINGSNVRLLDVQELLSDSGLGREMHVIVGQGRLDNVLQATPEDRRGFIEEAAGILKHRRRKEKTLRKLDAMQANLTRLSDLAGEVRRQLKPLGKQAEIAREAQTVASVVRDARARLLADDVVGLRKALDDHARTESERTTERMVLQERLDAVTLRTERITAAQSGDAVDAARRTAFALEQAQDRLRNLFALANSRLTLLEEQTEVSDGAQGVTPHMLSDAAAEVERLRGLVTSAEAAWAAAQSGTGNARRALDAVDEEIQAQAELVSRHDLEISKLTGQADTAQSRLAAVRGEVLRQQNALDAASTRREAARAAFALHEAEAATADAGETDLDEAYETAQNAVVEAEAGIERLREALHVQERERDALAARTSALSLALDQKDGSTELVAARLSGIRGLVADSVHVEPGFEAAIAAALGSLADAVLAETHDDAAAAIEHAGQGELGRVEVVVAAADARADAGGDGPVDVASAIPSTIRRAADVVRAPDGVLRILGHTLIADDLDSARTAWRALDDPTATTILTREGDVLTSYVLRGGSGAKRSRLELVADRDAATDRLATVAADIDRSTFALAEQRGILQSAKDRSKRALTALREFDSELAARTERLNRARVQVEAAGAEFDRLSASLALASEAVPAAESAAATARSALDTARSRPRPILDASARDALYAELEKARETEVETRLQVETAKERVRAEQVRGEQLAEQLERERAKAEAAARRAVLRRRQADAATAVLTALPPVLDLADRSVADARSVLARAEQQRASQNEELTGLRREEGTLRERLAAITENVHGLELQIYEKKLHLTSLLERAGSELGLVEDVLVAEYGPHVLVPDDGASDGADGAAPELVEGAARAPVEGAERDVPSTGSAAVGSSGTVAEATGTPYNREQQQRRLARAERSLAQLGRVNPLALEEFAALEQRHRFLTEQLTDLTDTRKDLLTIIDEIDEKMQDIFASAFDDTRQAFNEVFPVLFPGGSGSIHLTNPDDLLNTGIEVSVKPAGKKIERLSLLSGGERSLAAVALLIAIFKARPSPFYIMDEVEAALDDANLGRLLTIFEDLRRTSQLIVITHQKRTMEIADALYGVSMRQDGVSAVVGQRVATERVAS
ncbi:AAA family ATPase [Planctomonas psychrotolerans]|uniref:AAA family ATPase n=1 Tax=Planctomonas psychrotolerans TaxID=2528712 RepID=UPI00123B30BE|nr:AAA family ATPase [Planctomonas psychrotolerans]